MASPDEVRSCLRLLAEAGLKGCPEGERAPDMYALLLSDLSAPDLLAATLDHARESIWFPTPSELRHRALALAGVGEPTANEAWCEVVGYARRGWGEHHAGREFPAPSWSHPRIAEVLTTIGVSGGWVGGPERTVIEVAAMRKQFMELWESSATRQGAEARRAALPMPTKESMATLGFTGNRQIR